ncbi:MAG: hypothetical protein ACYC6C_01000 [Coriobacteriia bacterium]
MMRTTPRAAYVLSALIAALAAIVSVAGLFGGVYRDNTWITSAYQGTDIVTLLLAVPLLIAGAALSRCGSARGHLVWIAMLAYMLYGYCFYLFGAAFNVVFLLYAALVGSSLWALVLALASTDAAAFASTIRERMPRWPLASYLLVSATVLGVLWTAMSLGFVFTGDVPAPVVNSGHPTGVVFALDLTLIVPGMLVSAWWLLRRRAWGYLLGGIYAVKGAVYTFALSSSTVMAIRADVEGAGAELPMWIGLTVWGAGAAALLLWNVVQQSDQGA